MPFIHGKGTVVLLNAVDLSTFGTALEFVRTGDSHDVTTYGKNSHVYQGGLLDGTAKLSGVYDSTAGTGPRAVIRPLIGTNTALVHRPEGTGAGKPQDTVTVLVTSYTVTSPVADMVTWETELQMAGDVASVTQ